MRKALYVMVLCVTGAQAGQCPVTPAQLPDFDNADVYSAEAFTITARNAQGMLSHQGELWLDARYSEVTALGEDVLLAKKAKGGFVLTDTRTGKQADVPYQVYVPHMQNGLLQVSDGDLNGFMDRTGKLVVPLQFSSILRFSEGLAAVQQDGKWGYINAQGKQVLPVQYDHVYPFYEARSVVKKDGQWQIIDQQGQTIATLPYAGVSYLKGGYAAVFNGDPLAEDEAQSARWGVIDCDGREILPPRYEEVGFSGYYFAQGEDTPVASEGMIAVKENGLWGFVNVAGKVIVSPRYAGAAYPFVQGLAVVEDGEGMKGLVNQRGEELVPPTFAQIYMEDQQTIPDSGLIVLSDSKIEGRGNQVWVREKGEMMPSVYPNVLPVGKGLLAVEAEEGHGWTLYSSEGTKLTAVSYQRFDTFAQGLAAAQRDEKWGYIDETGKEVLAVQYEAVTPFQEDRALVKKDGRWQLIDRAGCVLATQP